MKLSSSLVAVSLLFLPLVSAQAQSFSTTPGASGEKPKVLQPAERQLLTGLCADIQTQFKLGEVGGSKAKSLQNAEMGTVSGGLSTELHGIWTRLVDIAQARGVESKHIPQEISKRDQAQLDKLMKEKDEKWAVEFYDILLKEVRHTAGTCATNAKLIKDEDLKKMVEEMNAMYKYQLEQIETARKTAKSTKWPKAEKEKK